LVVLLLAVGAGVVYWRVVLRLAVIGLIALAIYGLITGLRA